MIDRKSRDRLATAIRRYVSGQIHNDALDEVEVDWRDRGAVAVKQMAWQLYDDIDQHFATGDYSIPTETRRDIARWIVFLHSDRDYLWPEYHFVRAIWWPLNIITLGWWERREKRIWAEFCDAGDFTSWPFLNERECAEEVANPRYLAGKLERFDG